MSESLKFWIGNPMVETKIPAGFSLEDSITKITGEEKAMFLNFVGRMLKWKAEDRSTAKELLEDPWLHKDYPGC